MWMRGFFNIWVIGGAILFAVVLFAAAFALLWFTRPGPSVAGPATAVVNVIPAPTDTPSPEPTIPLPTPTPTRLVPPAPAPGVITLDAYVQITGTGGDGLRLRTDPGVESEVRLLGAEDEVFQVKDGPRESDGYTWWYLVGLYEATRRGWAVANYLGVVQQP